MQKSAIAKFFSWIRVWAPYRRFRDNFLELCRVWRSYSILFNKKQNVRPTRQKDRQFVKNHVKSLFVVFFVSYSWNWVHLWVHFEPFQRTTLQLYNWVLADPGNTQYIQPSRGTAAPLPSHRLERPLWGRTYINSRVAEHCQPTLVPKTSPGPAEQLQLSPVTETSSSATLDTQQLLVEVSCI